jgi:hypothetical protein
MLPRHDRARDPPVLAKRLEAETDYLQCFRNPVMLQKFVSVHT